MVDDWTSLRAQLSDEQRAPAIKLLKNIGLWSVKKEALKVYSVMLERKARQAAGQHVPDLPTMNYGTSAIVSGVLDSMKVTLI